MHWGSSEAGEVVGSRAGAEPCLPPQFLPFSFLSSMKSGTAGQQQWPLCFLCARKQAMTSCEAHTSREIPRFPAAEGGRRAGNDGNCVWQDILKRLKDRETFLLVHLSGLCNFSLIFMKIGTLYSNKKAIFILSQLETLSHPPLPGLICVFAQLTYGPPGCDTKRVYP